MECQFPKHTQNYLKRMLRSTKNEEQTLEVKLNESMPDIGRVICAWGQPVMRSKEWRGSSVGISGGVMAWILYASESGTEIQSVECWIPFQMYWDIPKSRKDGSIRLSLLLSDMDARSTSARKLMVRAVVCAGVEVLEPDQVEFYVPEQLPQDIQLLKKSYPVCMRREAGERNVTIDENIGVPATFGGVAKIICCNAQPKITEKRVMGDKLVFRGVTQLSCMWMCQDGTVRSSRHELPFSQYAELSGSYEATVATDIILAVTNLEPELLEDGTLRLKGSLVGQYVLWDTSTLTVIEDAYSLERTVKKQEQMLEVQSILGTGQETIKAEQPVDPNCGELIAGNLLLKQPEILREDGQERVEMQGAFQVLHQDGDGNALGETVKWNESVILPGDGENTTSAIVSAVNDVRVTRNAETMVCCDIVIDVLTEGDRNLNMVTALELGEAVEPDPGRPSLILMRMDERPLWEVAKSCGSTMEAILTTNGLTDEASPGQMLLIPVL